ncbi:MAG: hypothetical protein ABJN22_12420 [Litorimonas sp.]
MSKVPHQYNVQRLYDYTKFHIQMYATLVAAVLAAINFPGVFPKDDCKLLISGITTAALFALAGAFGGFICTNMLHYDGEVMVPLDQPAVIWSRRIWRVKLRALCSLEHAFFWIGIISGFVTTVFIVLAD